MRTIARGLRGFRRNYTRNIIVIVLLFACLSFSLSMLAVKLATESQIKKVKQTVGNYGEIKVSSDYLMKRFEEERKKSEAERAAEARRMTSEQEFQNRVETLVPEKLTDEFSKNSHIKTYDKVLETRITLPGLKSSEIQRAFQFRETQRGGIARGASSQNNFLFSGNTNGSSASDFRLGAKKIVEGRNFTYSDYENQKPYVVIEKNLASDNNLHVGDEIEAKVSGATGKDSTLKLTVIGIYETMQAQGENSNEETFNPAGSTFYAPVSIVQKLNGTPGYLSLGSYYFDSVDNTKILKASFEKLAGKNSSKYEFATDFSDYVEISDPLTKTGKTSVIGFAGALAACTLIILLSMMIIVSGRKREIGILKAIGSRDSQVIGQFAIEILCVCLVATILALGATAIIGQSLGNWLMPKAKTSVQKASYQSFPGPQMIQMMSNHLYKSGSRFNLAQEDNKGQSVKLNVVWRGSMFLYGAGMLLLISLIGMSIPILAITRLRPARVLSME